MIHASVLGTKNDDQKKKCKNNKIHIGTFGDLPQTFLQIFGLIAPFFLKLWAKYEFYIF